MYPGRSRLTSPAAVVKVMSIPDNRCIQVLIPDENVGRGGSHDVLLHDMADADSPYVTTKCDLMALHLDWPAVVLSGMIRHQLELEHMRHKCKKRFCNAQTGLWATCGKVIKLDMA